MAQFRLNITGKIWRCRRKMCNVEILFADFHKWATPWVRKSYIYIRAGNMLWEVKKINPCILRCPTITLKKQKKNNTCMAYWELYRCQWCMKRRQVRRSKDGNKQTERKTKPITLDVVGPGRLCVCDPGDNSISWCGKSPTKSMAVSPWKLITVPEKP